MFRPSIGRGQIVNQPHYSSIAYLSLYSSGIRDFASSSWSLWWECLWDKRCTRVVCQQSHEITSKNAIILKKPGRSHIVFPSFDRFKISQYGDPAVQVCPCPLQRDLSLVEMRSVPIFDFVQSTLLRQHFRTSVQLFPSRLATEPAVAGGQRLQMPN